MRHSSQNHLNAELKFLILAGKFLALSKRSGNFFAVAKRRLSAHE
jgi:hypothetical protein